MLGNSGVYTTRDREASRAIHKLFWKANFVDLGMFIIWLLMRPLSLLIYNVLIPFQIAYALQAIITQHFDQIGQYGTTILVLGVIMAVTWAIGGVAISRNGIVGSTYIQRQIFANYLEKDYDFFNTTFLGTLGSQAVRLREAFNDYCIILMNTMTLYIVMIISSVAIIAYHSWALALVTVVSMVLVLSFTIASGKWRLKYRRKLSDANAETAGIVGDALGHASTVKSFAAEDFELRHLDQSLVKLGNAQYWTWVSSIPADIGRLFLSVVAIMLLLVMTSHLYQQHAISIAIVVLVQLYVIRLVLMTRDIAEFIKSYESVMTAAHQAVKTMLVKPLILDKPNVHKFPSNNELTLVMDNVSFHYNDAPKSVMAINNFSLTIEPGEKIGLVGYSGSGKTTLTKLLLRFMDVTSGSMSVGGIDIRDMSQRELRAHIAYVPQEPLLFHRSIAENIAYGKPAASRKSLVAAGRAAYVDEFVAELSKGYDSLVGEKGVKLSGGQRQRVAIARALLKDAPILVLDEATSALDSRSEQYIQKALWKLMEGRTAIVIAHRLSTIQRMDRIVVMDKGKVVAIGTHQELLKSPKGIYAKLWAHQSGGYIGASTTAATD